MKINITGIRGIPAKHGGFETFAESLAIYLQKHDCAVTVYCQTSGWDGISQNDWHGIRRINISIPFGGSLSTIIFDLLCVWHICFFSRSLTLVLGYNTAIFSFFYRIFGITTIMNMDGIEWQRSKWGGAVKTWFKLNEWFACKFSNHLVADHEEIRAHLVCRHGALPITTIPYGAEAVTTSTIEYLQQFNLQPNQYYLVIARPEPENSIFEIVTAFVQSNSNRKLVLLGKYSQSVAYQARILNISDKRIVFLGAIYDRTIVSALRYYCFAYIHGHTVGGTNPSLVEAMGANCTVIAHDNRFNKGVCENSAFYFHDVQDLRKIIDGISDASINNQKKYSYNRFVDMYTLESVNRRYLSLFNQLSQLSR